MWLFSKWLLTFNILHFYINAVCQPYYVFILQLGQFNDKHEQLN